VRAVAFLEEHLWNLFLLDLDLGFLDALRRESSSGDGESPGRVGGNDFILADLHAVGVAELLLGLDDVGDGALFDRVAKPLGQLLGVYLVSGLENSVR